MFEDFFAPPWWYLMMMTSNEDATLAQVILRWAYSGSLYESARSGWRPMDSDSMRHFNKSFLFRRRFHIYAPSVAGLLAMTVGGKGGPGAMPQHAFAQHLKRDGICSRRSVFPSIFPHTQRGRISASSWAICSPMVPTKTFGKLIVFGHACRFLATLCSARLADWLGV